MLHDVNNTAYFNKEVASKIGSRQEGQNAKRAVLESTCMRNPVKNAATMLDLHFTSIHFTRDRSDIKSELLHVIILHKTNKSKNQNILAQLEFTRKDAPSYGNKMDGI